MPKMNIEDLKYYQDIISQDKKSHQQMISKHMPEAVMDAYEGLICERDGDDYKVAGDMVENYLLIAVNTVLPGLFYQVPRPIIRGMREELKYSASVIAGLIKVYARDDFKTEVQLCLIDAFLPYPFACMKVGYNSRTGKYSPTPSLLTGKTEGGNDKSMEASQEYLKYEKPFIERQSPKYTYMDSSKPFNKGTRVTFEYTRTLQELIDSNLYSIDENFIRYFKVKNENDARKAKITIMEHWCMINGYAWKLVYTPDWHDEELAWGKTSYVRLPVELIRFNDLGDRLYTISPGFPAYKAQKELNYQNEIWKEHIDKTRRQHIVDFSGLHEDGIKTLKTNEIDGIVRASRPVGTIYQQISSNPMGKDVYAGIDNIRQYLKLSLSASGGKGGETEAEFAYTEKQQAIGDMMRSSGNQDKVRVFARNILKKMVSNIVKFGDPQITIQITGKNVVDPITGETITGKEMQIGGPEGLKLQEEIKGDVENDYIYDVDIASAQRPDMPVVRAQLKEAGEFLIALEPRLAQENKKVEVAEFAQDYLNTFDNLVDPEKYISDMAPEDTAMMQARMAMAAGGATGAPGPVKKPPINIVPREPNAGVQPGA